MFSNFSFETLLYTFVGLFLFLLSGSIHEFSHAFSAYILGDNTAKNNGRLTINPAAHIDIFGSIVFPLIGIFSGLPVFGWMKPVPINPLNFNNPSKGSAITSFAGPFSNLFQACTGIIILKLIVSMYSTIGLSVVVFSYMFKFVMLYININLILMMFNLIPVPPLDGGWILRHFLSDALKPRFDILYRYGTFILIIILMTGLFRIIFIPVRALSQFLYSNIDSINIVVLSLPFFVLVFIIYFFLNKDIKNFIRKKEFNLSRKKQEMEYELQVLNTNKQNVTISQNAKDILYKLKNKIKLNSVDRDDIKRIEQSCNKIGNLCDDIDFNIEDSHCINCENYLCCLLREIKKT